MKHDILGQALKNKKDALHSGFKISIEVDPSEMKDEEKEKKLGLAPSVKDAESPKEEKLIATEGDVDSAELPSKEMSEEQSEDQVMKMMPEMPTERAPISLHEKAMAAMLKHKEEKKLKK